MKNYNKYRKDSKGRHTAYSSFFLFVDKLGLLPLVTHNIERAALFFPLFVA